MKHTNILFLLHNFHMHGILTCCLETCRQLTRQFGYSCVVAAPPIGTFYSLFHDAGVRTFTFSDPIDLINKLNTISFSPHLVLRESLFAPDPTPFLNYYRCKLLTRILDEIPLFEKLTLWFSNGYTGQDSFKTSCSGRFTFVSAHTRDHYRPLLLKNSIQRTSTIFPLIDEDKLTPMRTPPNSDRFTILQVGTIYQRKGAIQTLHAFNLFLSKVSSDDKSKIELIFIGDRRANQTEERYSDNLRSEIANYKLGKHVTIYPTSPSPFELVTDFDILTLHSVSEGAPLVFFESLCLGRPVICSDAGGAKEIISQPFLGRIFSVDDVETQACLFLAFFKERKAKRDDWRKISNHFDNHYSPRILAEKLNLTIQDALA